MDGSRIPARWEETIAACLAKGSAQRAQNAAGSGPSSRTRSGTFRRPSAGGARGRDEGSAIGRRGSRKRQILIAATGPLGSVRGDLELGGLGSSHEDHGASARWGERGRAPGGGGDFTGSEEESRSGLSRGNAPRRRRRRSEAAGRRRSVEALGPIADTKPSFLSRTGWE